MKNNTKNKFLILTLCLTGLFSLLESKDGHLKKTKLTKKEISGKVQIKSSTPNTQSSSIPKRIETSIESKNDVLEKHLNLRRKALLNENDRAVLDDYFTNSKNIRIAYLTLLSKKFDNLDDSIDKRINATNFLMDGLQRKNIDKSEILKATEMFLLSDNEERTQDINIRRAIVGDKVDLYNALLNYAPEEAKKFKESYMSKRLKNVIKYVEINNKRNRG